MLHLNFIITIFHKVKNTQTQVHIETQTFMQYTNMFISLDQTPLDHLKKLASKAVGSFEVLKGAQDTIKTLPHFVVEYEYVHVDED